MEIWDNRTRLEIERDNRAICEVIMFVSSIIAVICMLMDFCG